jgi:hypothetical protein
MQEAKICVSLWVVMAFVKCKVTTAVNKTCDVNTQREDVY